MEQVEQLTKLEDFLSAVPSKSTRKNYRNGIRKFEKLAQQYRVPCLPSCLLRHLLSRPDG